MKNVGENQISLWPIVNTQTSTDGLLILDFETWTISRRYLLALAPLPLTEILYSGLI